MTVRNEMVEQLDEPGGLWQWWHTKGELGVGKVWGATLCSL